jgi:hypothetical protein
MKIRFLFGPLNGTEMFYAAEKPSPVITVSAKRGTFWYELEMYDDIEQMWVYALEREKLL